MSPTKAAEIIGCSPRHVRTLIRSGKLAAERTVDGGTFAVRYEITAEELRRFLRGASSGRGFPRGAKRSGPRGKKQLPECGTCLSSGKIDDSNGRRQKDDAEHRAIAVALNGCVTHSEESVGPRQPNVIGRHARSPMPGDLSMSNRADSSRMTFAGPTRQPRYPWDAWFSRQEFTLRRGVDFFCQPYSMMILVRLKAKQRGFRVTVHIQEDRLTVTIVRKPIDRSDFVTYVTSRDLLANMTARDRRVCVRTTEYAIRLLQDRTGASQDPYNPTPTYDEWLKFLGRHPRLLRCVKHIHVENGNKNQIGRYLSLGYAAGLLYLMGSSATGPDQYYKSDNRTEGLLDWSRWDKACDFWTQLAAGGDKLKAVCDAFSTTGKLYGGIKEIPQADRRALLVLGWLSYVENEGKVKPGDLNLDYEVDEEDGTRRLLGEPPIVGGIDRGQPQESDEGVD